MTYQAVSSADELRHEGPRDRRADIFNRLFFNNVDKSLYMSRTTTKAGMVDAEFRISFPECPILYSYIYHVSNFLSDCRISKGERFDPFPLLSKLTEHQMNVILSENVFSSFEVQHLRRTATEWASSDTIPPLMDPGVAKVVKFAYERNKSNQLGHTPLTAEAAAIAQGHLLVLYLYRLLFDYFSDDISLVDWRGSL